MMAYQRAHDSVYLKKYKFQSSVYLTLYRDNYQYIGLQRDRDTTPMNTTIDTN